MTLTLRYRWFFDKASVGPNGSKGSKNRGIFKFAGTQVQQLMTFLFLAKRNIDDPEEV